MDPVWFVSLAGIACVSSVSVIVGVVALAIRRHDTREVVYSAREISDAVAAAAEKAGLAVHAEGVWEGTPGGRRVRWSLRDVEHENGPVLQLAMGTPVPTGYLGLTHRTLVYGAEPPELELPECRVGDAAFDVRFHVHADLEHLSMLTPAVRQALLVAAGDGELRVRSEWLWIDQRATPAHAQASAARTEAMFAAAAQLEAVSPEVEQRVRWLSQDPVARVRATTLEMLAARGVSDFTSWIARSLLADPDVRVRSRAAEVLGDAERLLELVTDATAPLDVRARAGRALDAVAGTTERVAALEILARGPSALQEVALDLCRTLGEASEAVLMDLVGSPDGRISRQAVSILGRVGTSRALGVLQAVVEAPDRPLLRIEANAALEAMRSRSASSRRALRSTPPVDARTATPRPRTRERGGDPVRRLPPPER